jgi:hypothetical protein
VRAHAIGSSADHLSEQGGLRSVLFGDARKLLIEAVVIAVLIGGAAITAYYVTHDTVVNRRTLGGHNVVLQKLGFDQTQYGFATSDGKTIVGASNDLGAEVLDVFTSTNGGKAWTRTDGPEVPGSCAQGLPQVATTPGGGQFIAFLAAPVCGRFQSLTPFLVTSTRPGATGRWSRIQRVAQPEWEFGFDDGPSLAAAENGKRLYLTWTRSYSKFVATTVVSSSGDAGKTWTAPVVLSKALVHPHLATSTVASDGTLYLAGIDAKLGLWATRSTDGGKTFAAPVPVAKLLGNPAAQCAQTAEQPLPRETRQCNGPDPTILVQGDHVLVVYTDFGVNQTPDVHAVGLDRSLRPLFRSRVSPVDTSKTQQLAPSAAVDTTTGTAWACWYDTTFDPNADRVWYTCAASKDGHSWSEPVRAASQPTKTDDLYGTIFRRGLRNSIVATQGVAHPFWADGRDYVQSMDVYTAAIPERVLFGTHP